MILKAGTVSLVSTPAHRPLEARASAFTVIGALCTLAWLALYLLFRSRWRRRPRRRARAGGLFRPVLARRVDRPPRMRILPWVVRGFPTRQRP